MKNTAHQQSIVLILTLLAAACGDDSTVPVGGGGQVPTGGSSPAGGGGMGGAGGSEGGAGLAIEWVPCPLSSDATTGDDAFCATIQVPLDWDEPDGEQIDFFVKKVPSEQQPPRGQLWLLNGGPGYSGADFEAGAQAQTVDIYLPDHRGTGRSSRLACPAAEDDASPGGFVVTDEELPDCVDALEAAWGDRLRGFTITNAARDVGEVIEATRLPDDDILIDGGSYGSIWANRYLQIYPEQASGVVMGAFAVGLLLTRDDAFFNELGERWMAACAADTECSGKLGAIPWATMTAAVDALEAGACPEIVAQGWDRRELHRFWSFFFYTWEYRSLIAPMVYRLNRCEPRDVIAFQNLHDAFTQPQAPTAAQRFFSTMLSTHVLLSEMWEDPPPTVAELEAYQATANVAHGIAAPAQGVYDAWPRYEKDRYSDAFADTNIPILMTRGEYDFIPLEGVQAAVDHFASGGTFLLVPNAPHNPNAAPPADGGPSCGSVVRSQFFADPTAVLDTSCIREVAPLPLAPSPALSAAAFGVTNPWDGTPAPLGLAPEAAQLRAASGELRMFRRG